MILKLQIFNVIANENARYKRNELEYIRYFLLPSRDMTEILIKRHEILKTAQSNQ